MTPNVAIIGAGVAGTIASSGISSYSPTVFEAGEERPALAGHSAVMRLRDPQTALLLGCAIEKVTVHKAIYFQKALHHRASIKMNNLYSRKVSGELTDKSLFDTDTCERYLIAQDVKPIGQIKYGWKLRSITNRVMRFGKLQDCWQYNFCISTIPLPALLKILGIDTDLVFKTKPIYTLRAHLKIKSRVHQTIYVPEPEYSTYRVTLQNNIIIFEAVAPIRESERWEMAHLFGVTWLDEVDHPSELVQKCGKIVSVDETARRALLYQITDDYRIFSFGRYAIWKPVRMDELTRDLDKIKRMMQSMDSYELNKERMQ